MPDLPSQPPVRESRGVNPLVLALISFIIPFLGFLLLIFGGESVRTISFQNYGFHSLLLLITCGLASYTSYIAYKEYSKNKDVRVFIVSLAFYVFGFVFFAHAISVPGWGMFSDAVFDVNEHYGLFFGSVVLLGLIFPLSSWQEDIYKHKGKIIFAVTAFLVLSFIFLISLAPLAALLEEIVNITIGATGLFFAVSLVFLIRQYRQKAHPLLFYLIMGLAVLLNSSIIPLFYQEWGLLWWYFHLTFLAGFAVILFGVLKTKPSKDNLQFTQGFESAFGPLHLYSKISTKIVALFVPLILVAIFTVFNNQVIIERIDLAREHTVLDTQKLVLAARLDFLTVAISRTMYQSSIFLSMGNHEGLMDEMGKMKIQKAERQEVIKQLKDKSAQGYSVFGSKGIEVEMEEVTIVDKIEKQLQMENAKDSEIMEEMMMASEKEDVMNIIQKTETELRPMTESLDTLIDEFMDDRRVEINEWQENIKVAEDSGKMSLTIIAGFSIAIIILSFLLITKLLVKPILALTKTVQAIAGGDLHSRANVKTKDEIGQLGQSFNTMTESLLKTNVDIRQKAEELEAQNEELEAASAELEKAKTGLEGAVAERTAELEKAKTGLENEVRQRTVELQKTNEELHQQKLGLEEEVAKRTEDLQDKLLELERFNKIAVGRELKMVDLKKEIAKLKDANSVIAEKNKI